MDLGALRDLWAGSLGAITNEQHAQNLARSVSPSRRNSISRFSSHKDAASRGLPSAHRPHASNRGLYVPGSPSSRSSSRGGSKVSSRVSSYVDLQQMDDRPTSSRPSRHSSKSLSRRPSHDNRLASPGHGEGTVTQPGARRTR